MKFEKFLLETEHEYNGHKQTLLNNFPIKKGVKLCKKLEKFTLYAYSFILEVSSDGSYSIYQVDYFPEDNPTGRNRLILGVDNACV